MGKSECRYITGLLPNVPGLALYFVQSVQIQSDREIRSEGSRDNPFLNQHTSRQAGAMRSTVLDATFLEDLLLCFNSGVSRAGT